MRHTAQPELAMRFDRARSLDERRRYLRARNHGIGWQRTLGRWLGRWLGRAQLDKPAPHTMRHNRQRRHKADQMQAGRQRQRMRQAADRVGHKIPAADPRGRKRRDRAVMRGERPQHDIADACKADRELNIISDTIYRRVPPYSVVTRARAQSQAQRLRNFLIGVLRRSQRCACYPAQQAPSVSVRLMRSSRLGPQSGTVIVGWEHKA